MELKEAFTEDIPHIEYAETVVKDIRGVQDTKHMVAFGFTILQKRQWYQNMLKTYMFRDEPWPEGWTSSDVYRDWHQTLWLNAFELERINLYPLSYKTARSLIKEWWDDFLVDYGLMKPKDCRKLGKETLFGDLITLTPDEMMNYDDRVLSRARWPRPDWALLFKGSSRRAGEYDNDVDCDDYTPGDAEEMSEDTSWSYESGHLAKEAA